MERERQWQLRRQGPPPQQQPHSPRRDELGRPGPARPEAERGQQQRKRERSPAANGRGEEAGRPQQQEGAEGVKPPLKQPRLEELQGERGLKQQRQQPEAGARSAAPGGKGNDHAPKQPPSKAEPAQPRLRERNLHSYWLGEGPAVLLCRRATPSG